MLQSLYIKDFILIEKLSLDFSSGFSVFTGETGAGKSIFIDAIGVLTGNRMTGSMVRHGANKAIVEGQFSVNDRLAEQLAQAGLDNETMIVTREISADGKSTTRINQRNVTVSFLKECLAGLVDIHCQHDNQYLLNEKYHLQLLDSYGSTPLSALKEAYDNYRLLQKKYDELLNNELNEAQGEIIRFQLEEIKKLNPKAGEDEEIDRTLKNAARQEKLQQSVNELKNLFAGENGVLTRLYELKKMTAQFRDFTEIGSQLDDIDSSYYALSEDYETVSSFFDKTSISLEDIDALNQRLYDLQRLKRKHGLSIEGILKKAEEMQQQLTFMEDREAILASLAKQRDEAFRKYEKEAETVSEHRKKAAARLEKEVEKELHDLSLEHGIFKAVFTKGEPSEKGLDKVSFHITLNPGQPLAPLVNVASGGEISRLMLGLKTVFARLQGTELVVFDEIDTGVSGYVAYNIGLKMKQIAETIQVFSVTHLAAIAANGLHHYHIEKYQSEDNTATEVRLLSKEERIRELAIMSSSNTSDASLKAAKELLERAAHESK